MSPEPILAASLGRFPWMPVAWISVLLIVCFAPVLQGMVLDWMNNDDMGHGFFVPVLALWIVWTRKDTLLQLPMRPNAWGLVLVLLGAAQLIAGTLGAELFVSRTAFLVSLSGILLYAGGTPLLRVLAFPLFLLLFMVRIPAILYSQITFPLQIFASSVAEHLLWMIGIPVLREGNILELSSQRLSVVEACSGIRSLLSLSFLSLIYAHSFDSKVWMRGALLVATVPIAVAANAFRVTLTGVLSEYNPELAQGFIHSAEGWIIFLISMIILIAVHKAINLAYGAFRTPR
ncbi:MAG: exosortase [Acidobacteriia bacterium]|nr:exosortase [Terriglobia bacterium]